MNDYRFPQARDLSPLIDRLAADELDDGSRGELFAWLDREPTRWRRCALALLEVRELEGALDDWLGESDSNLTPQATRQRPVAPPDESRSGDGRSPAKGERRSGRYAMLAIAASVALAFGLGMAADRRFVGWRGVEAPQPVAQAARSAAGGVRNEASHDRETGSDEPRQRETSDGGEESGGGELAQQSEPVASRPSSAAEKQLIPPYVKSQLERRGYRVDSRRQFLSVTLPDGRRVSAPVGLLKFSYVGNRAY